MKKFYNFCLITALIVGFLSSNAQVGNVNADKIPLNPKVKEGRLPNGLRYFIMHNEKPENKVELRLAVNAGSVLEDDNQLGLAHFMEHMNFNGLKNFPKNEIIHYLQSIGVEFGNDLNAYTSFDETVYILPVPTDQPGKLDSAFMILADWSNGALLTDEDIDNERGVILAESRLGKGADDRMMKKYFPAMFNGSKYADRLPIGKDSIIEHFDYSVLRKFYKDWYRPSLQAVVVVGDMPVEEAEKKIIEKFSGYNDPSMVRERPARIEVLPYEESRAMVVSDPEASRTIIRINGSPAPANYIVTEKDFYEDLIEDLVSGMLNMRLNELRSAANPPFIYGYGYSGGFVNGYENFTLLAVCGSEDIKDATEALIMEMNRAKKYGFTEAELQRVKASVVSNYERAYNERDKMESAELTNELENYFLVGEAAPGIEWEYNFIKNNIDKITLNDLQFAIDKMNIDQKYFAYITSKTGESLPSDETFKSWIDEALVKEVQPYTEKALANSLLEKEPVPGKIISTVKNEKLGTITYMLANNTTVCIKPTDFKNDEILIKGVRFGGYSLYPDEFESAMWSNNAIEEMGYGKFSNPDLRKFLFGKIVNVRPSVGPYTDNIDGNCSVKDMETMFQLMYLKCTQPLKDESAYASYVSRARQSIESMKQNPRMLFMDSAYNTFYNGNKKAHLIYNPSDYDKMNIDAALRIYMERIGNAYGMYYTIVGNFTEETIKPFIEKYIGGLPSKEIKVAYKDMGLAPVEGKQQFTLHKGSEPQGMLSYYITGQLPYDEKDNFLLSHLNEIINNKVTDNIREKMGAIYGGGISGSLKKYPKEEFLMQAMFPCGPDNISAIDTAFMAILQTVQKDGGITESDLRKVKEPELEHYEVNIKENSYWLNYMINSYLNGNNPERILEREQRIKSITVKDMTETARKFYSGNNIFKAQWLPEVIR